MLVFTPQIHVVSALKPHVQPLVFAVQPNALFQFVLFQPTFATTTTGTQLRSKDATPQPVALLATSTLQDA